MALTTDERPHLLAGRVPVRVVVRDALLGLERLDPGQERGAGHAQGHGLRLVAVHAGERVLEQKLPLVVPHAVRLFVGHAGYLLEALRDVALADEAVQGEVRGVALDARARLFLLGHPACLLLIEEGVRVAPAVAVVEGKGVAGEDAPEPRVPVELLLRGSAVTGTEAPGLRTSSRWAATS